MTETGQKTIRVLIVDDHVLMRAGLRMLVESREGMEVAAEAGDADEALDCARREQPDTILLVFDPGGGNDLELIADLRAAAPSARAIVITGSPDPAVHARAVRLSAMGVVQKDRPAQVLFKAIEKVHEGEVWFDRAVLGAVLFDRGRLVEEQAQANRLAALTAREREIVAMLCEGKKNKEVARLLQITESTVSHHLTSIYNKLNVSDRLGLVTFAFSHMIASPPGAAGKGGRAAGTRAAAAVSLAV